MSDLTPELKSLLARLCVADSTYASFTTVAEERAFVRELVAVVGAPVAFKALAKHINDFTSTTTYGSTPYTVYPGQDYKTREGSNDVLLNIGSGVLTPGQDIALAMLIRANISLDEMTKVISHANLLAYIELRAPSTNSANAGTTKPIVEANDSDFTTTLHKSRIYQYDISQFFTASGISTFKFGDDVSTDDIMFIISKSALYTSAADGSSDDVMAAKTIALKMITQLIPISSDPTVKAHPLRSATAIGDGFKAVTASSSGFFYDGQTYTASSGVTFSRSSTLKYLATGTQVIEYVTNASGKKTHTLSSTVDSYYLPTSSFTFNLNLTTTAGNFTINGDKLISADELGKYTVTELLNFGLTTLEIKGLGKPLAAIISALASTTPYTPSLALADGWSLSDVRNAYPLFKDLTQSGTAFNVTVTPAGATGPVTFKLVTVFNPTSPDTPYSELINKLKEMYTTLSGSSNGSSNAFVLAIREATKQLPNYVANDSTWSTANNLTASVARWIYTTTNEQMAVDRIVGKMSIAILKGLLPKDLDERAVVKESELATFANGAITSGISPSDLITIYKLTAKSAIRNGWPLSLVMNSFSAQELLVKTPDNSNTPPTAAITITQALIGREWVSDTSPVASANKSVDNIPFKTIKSVKGLDGFPIYSDEEILSNIRDYMRANGNALNLTGKLNAFLSDLHLPFAVVRKLLGAEYGPSGATVSKADIAALKNYTKAQRRSVYTGIVDAVSSLTRDEINTADFVALGWPVSEWQAYAANANGVTITISLRDLLGAFERISIFDPESFVIYGAETSTPTDQRAIYHTKEERIALVTLFTGKNGLEAERLALGPLEDLDEITL